MYVLGESCWSGAVYMLQDRRRLLHTRKYWRGIKFGGLVVLEANHQIKMGIVMCRHSPIGSIEVTDLAAAFKDSH